MEAAPCITVIVTVHNCSEVKLKMLIYYNMLTAGLTFHVNTFQHTHFTILNLKIKKKMLT